MATMAETKDTLTFLQSVLKLNDWQRKELTQESDSFFEAYYFVLKSYTEKEIRNAALKCCDELTFYPTPKEMADRVTHRQTDKHTKELIEMYTCQNCKERVSAISNGECLDCAQINPQMALQERPIKPIKREDFRMNGRMMCQKCKTGPKLCICEPSKSGQWLCVNCYRGFDNDEHKRRLREVMTRAFQKDYIPSWKL